MACSRMVRMPNQNVGTETVERSHQLAVRGLQARIASEFAEMPGMTLTLNQACRLWSMGRDTCEQLLQDLVSAGVLRCTTDGRYLRSEG